MGKPLNKSTNNVKEHAWTVVIWDEEKKENR